LHPNYNLKGKRSLLETVFAILTLGGSILAKQHWEVGNWTHSFKHKAIALLEAIPLIGGIIALLERLCIHFLQKETSQDEILKAYFLYMKKSPDRMLISAKEVKQKLSVKCSLIDHFSFPLPVYTVFFYPKHIDKQRIVHALERTLEDFPLFAGRLKKTDGHLYIDCNNQGIEITTLYSEARLADFLSQFPKLSATAFVNEIDPHAALKNALPLFSIKLSYFSEGLAIGYSWHHSVGDMSTFMQFLSAVSAAAKGEKIPTPLVLRDREKDLYRNDLKGWEFGKEAPQNFCSEQATIAQRQGASENENCEAKPTQTKTDSSIYFGIRSIHTETEHSPSADLKVLNFGDIFQLAKQQTFPPELVYLYFSNEELDTMRTAFSNEAAQKLTRNDALCGHLLEAVAACREDDSDTQCASIAINARKKLKLDPNTPGNILGMATIQLPKNSSSTLFAKTIHQNVSNYSLDFAVTEKFVQEQGGMEKIKWIIPIQFLPKYRNLIFTTWANSGVYSIDFGVVPPDLFLPVGQVPLPWAARIVEGFQNQGRLVALTLPSKVAQRITQPERLQNIHRYRSQTQQDPIWEWVK